MYTLSHCFRFYKFPAGSIYSTVRNRTVGAFDTPTHGATINDIGLLFTIHDSIVIELLFLLIKITPYCYRLRMHGERTNE